MMLTARVKVALIAIDHGIKISALNGIVFVKSEATLQQESSLTHDIEIIAKRISGVKDVRIDVEPIIPFSE